ncbi:MAG TPA: alpha/beta hydrolase [Devosia sp.]|nr:alpha/beta hydrolase [Devosia sp.]
MDDYLFAEIAAPKGAPLLLLFHGTGGDENDLVGLGRQLMPDAHIVSPRGDVSESGALRFFRRAGEGIYDMADFARATEKMTGFIARRAAAIGPSSVTALGFSNGANIIAGVLFTAPGLLDRAVLMHPLIPFEPAPQPGLAGKPVLITAGRGDRIAPPSRTEALAEYFLAQGAASRVAWQEAGHDIRRPEVLAVRDFLAS